MSYTNPLSGGVPRGMRATTSRGLLGFTAATVAAQPSCGLPPLRLAPCPGSPGAADTLCVSSLNVAGTLTTNVQVGSTLTLLGTGTVLDSSLEAALCVQAGASIAGLSQHGQLRVVNDSCMGGPLSVSNVYGPTTVSFPPGGAAIGAALSVVGGAAVDDLTATGAVVADTVQAASALIVNDYDASPMALADVWSRISSSVVTVCATVVDGFNSYNIMQQGFVVANPNPVPTGLPGSEYHQYVVVTSARAFLQPSASNLSTATPILLETGSTVMLVFANGTSSVAGTVAARCDPAGAAVITFNEPPTFAADAVPALTSFDNDEDTPLAGTPAFITVINPLSGGVEFQATSVADPSVSVLTTVTSLTVAVPTLYYESYYGSYNSGPSMGGPIFILTPLGGGEDTPARNLTIKVAGMLLHGGASAVYTYNSDPYNNESASLLGQFGGPRGRVLKHFTDEFFATSDVSPTPSTLTLPLPYFFDGEGGSYVPAMRGIIPLQRYTSTTTPIAGGVTDLSYAVSDIPPGRQFVSLVNTTTEGPPAPLASSALGNVATNTPSLLDAALALFKQDNVTSMDASTYTAPAAGPTGTYTIPTPFLTDDLFNANSPNSLLTGNPRLQSPSTTFKYTTVQAPGGRQYLYMDTFQMSLVVQPVNLSAVSPASTYSDQTLAIQFGQWGQQVKGGYFNNIAFFMGATASVLTYMQGLATVWAAWKAAGGPSLVSSSLPAQIMALAGVTGAAGATFKFAVSSGLPYQPLSFGSGPSSVTLRYDQATSAVTAISSSGSVSTSLTVTALGFQSQSQNAFSFYVQPSGGSSSSPLSGISLSTLVGAQEHTCVINDGSTVTTQITTDVLTSGPLYPQFIYA